MLGRTISHYKILEKIGEGGMGVVYKATDSRLDRTVALKFLAAQALESGEAKSRFTREAKAAASLDHSNICTVHEIDEADGQVFLAMAFVDGPSLKEKIAERPLKLDEALGVAIQIGDGLAAAHEAGIVHRDIKPGNILINKRGQAKILDFGLAHLGAATQITKTGTVIGTPAYMSPEQVRGEKADRRTDVWSLGIVIYEMVTGRLPFQGESAQAVALSIQSETPEPPTALRSGIPKEVDGFVAKALAKDPAGRYQHVEDLIVDLRRLKQDSDSGSGGQAVVIDKKRSRWYVVAAVLSALLIGWLAREFFRSKMPEESASAPLPVAPLTSYDGREIQPCFSPDGSQVAFTWNGLEQNNFDIYVKLVGPGDPQRRTTHPARDYSPAWSPDGRFIAFQRDLGGHEAAVILVPALGGQERQVAEVKDDLLVDYTIPPPRLAWSPDSRRLAFSDRAPGSEASALFLLSVDTGEMRQLTAPSATDRASPRSPAFSPDGRNLAFIRGGRAWVLSLSDSFDPIGEEREIGQPVENLSATKPLWSSDGRELLLPSAGRLWRVDIAGEGAARPVPSITGVPRYPALSHSARRLAYSEFQGYSDIWLTELAGASGKSANPTRLASSTKPETRPCYSSDGSRIVFASSRTGRNEIWRCDSNGLNIVQLTTAGGGSPRWSPDGGRIAFDANRDGKPGIFVMDADGGNQRQLIEGPFSVPSWSRDGRWIYYGGASQIWRVPSDGGEPVQVTNQGGYVAIESADGEHVYYTKHDGLASLWRVPASGGEEIQILDAVYLRNFDVTGDGIYFIPASEASEYTVKLFRFATGETETAVRLDGQAGYGLSVSPDGKSILWCQGHTGSDIMLVENFR